MNDVNWVCVFALAQIICCSLMFIVGIWDAVTRSQRATYPKVNKIQSDMFYEEAYIGLSLTVAITSFVDYYQLGQRIDFWVGVIFIILFILNCIDYFSSVRKLKLLMQANPKESEAHHD